MIGADADLRHLLGRLARVEARVRRAVADRRQHDPNPGDPFRGMYLSDEAVLRLLEQADEPLPDQALAVEPDGGVPDDDPVSSRLRDLEAGFQLIPLDVEILLIALAPDVDSRFERLYGYLNDDVTRRRASVGLALELCGVPVGSWSARARFTSGPLPLAGLLVVEDTGRPLLSRGLRVPDRVVAHLLGDDGHDPALDDVLRDPPAAGVASPALVAGIRNGLRLGYLREGASGGGVALACASARAAGRQALVLDWGTAVERNDLTALVGDVVREARLVGGVLVCGPVDPAGPGKGLLRGLAASRTGVLLTGGRPWERDWARAQPVLFDVPSPTAEEQRLLWCAVLDARLPDHLDPAAITTQFRLGADQITDAAWTVRRHAEVTGLPVTERRLQDGARAQSASGLEHLTRRIRPEVGWDDLVLPPPVQQQVREVASRARQRDRVLGEWGMRPGGGRGGGVTALFAGEPGTGKTMATEVVAADLGLDLYAVDLATVVDKYVGETEKNLDRIFTEATRANGILLFDEADAVFGKRAEVHDAHDRYANIESSYLLQQMESFDGLAILATNLRANLDPALTRRLDLVVDFPMPEEALRLQLWDRCLGDRLPRAHDLDLGFCARSFRLSGGDIRSVAITAAYAAADDGGVLTTERLVAAVRWEYRKLGRLVLAAEFGRYHASGAAQRG